MSAKGGIKLNGSLENGSLGFTMWERHSKAFFRNNEKEKRKSVQTFYYYENKKNISVVTMSLESIYTVYHYYIYKIGNSNVL